MSKITFITVTTGLIVFAFVVSPVIAQDNSWTAPRTAFGQPDLQGTWANNNATPLQRPEVLGDRAYLTDEELSAIQSKAAELFSLDANDAAFGDTVFTAALAEVQNFTSNDRATGNYNQFWMVERDWDNRTSLITSTENGRIPDRTQAAKMRAADAGEKRQRHAVWTDDRSLGERCLSFGAPRLGAGYNNYYQVLQTPDYVVIQVEMGHDSRIIPLDGRPHVNDNIRQWLGNSRGYWDDDTLVVETKNYSPYASVMGSADNLHVTERFTRVSEDVLQYEVTLDDPTTWTEPWTAMIPLKSSSDALFEYACHEGNIGMEGILAGARHQEAEEAGNQ
tara:strand:+ start:320 stop:1324 length:1005 start_codon:yes stop_codon:yes gene_type:complete